MIVSLRPRAFASPLVTAFAGCGVLVALARSGLPTQLLEAPTNLELGAASALGCAIALGVSILPLPEEKKYF